MEVDFDKEIDTLLRKAQRDAPVSIGDFPSRHLDADEVSAFAENAMPENSRALYSAHLADCDRCRKILSNLLMMNAEAAPAAASPGVITIAERIIPWHKRLFLFPNLAYVMGGLVLVFAGFLAYSIVQKTNSGGDAMVSQVAESDQTRGGPSFQSEPSYPPEVSNSASVAANSAANTNTSSSGAILNANGGGGGGVELKTEKAPISGARADENNFVLDGKDSSADVAAAAPPPPATTQPAPKDVLERAELARPKADDKVAAGVTIQEPDKNSETLSMMRKENLPGSVAQSGPMRNNDSQYNRQLENLNGRRVAAEKKKAAARDEESSSGRRAVGGKTFEHKQGVWYDVTFQGRPTINIRRGTEEFNRLDGELRSIANTLGGTVVIVWGAKAYRVQ